MKKIILLISLMSFLGCSNLGTFNEFGRHSITGTYYDLSGYDVDGFDKEGYNKNGIDRLGFNKEGVNIYTGTTFDVDGYDFYGYDKDGYNRNGYDINDYGRDGYDRNGYDKNGYNKKGVHRYAEIFHILAWGDLYSPNGDSIRMYYDVNAKSLYDDFFGYTSSYRINLAKYVINKYGDFRFYKRDLVKKNFEKIYNNDSYKNYINIEKLMDRDLKIYREIKDIYETRKQTETFEEFIIRKINVLENYKKTLDKVMVFKMNGKELKLEYDPYNEILKINKNHIFEKTNSLNLGSYTGSNAFGVSKKVERIAVWDRVVNIINPLDYNSTSIVPLIYKNSNFDFYIPKRKFQENNCDINNLVIEFIVITNSHQYITDEKDPTIYDPIKLKISKNIINYELLGVKIRYNNKIIYKNSYI